MIKILMFTLLFSGIATLSWAKESFEKDVFETSEGELEITFIGHGSLLITHRGKSIYIDPFGKLADYSVLQKADLILLTHAHRDHLDPEAIAQIRTADTIVVLPEICASAIEDGVIMKNGEAAVIEGLNIEAVPAYNIIHKRDDGTPFHPKGEGNGYILTFGDKRMYVAGDTENIVEMHSLKEIDIAFLPMNLPYTMTPEMAADAAKSFKPSILYPYHFGETKTAKLTALLENDGNIEVRIRQMQ